MAELQSAMSSQEFGEWMAFFQLQPYGEWRQDFRTANLMALIANVNRDPKKSKEFTPQDFMPDFEKALDERQAQEDVLEHERVWNKVKTAFGGLVKPPSRPSPKSKNTI